MPKLQRTSTLALLLCLMLGLITLLHPTSAGASGHSAIRHLSDSSVSPGADLTVTITATGYGGFGQLVETIPEGFSYKETSLEFGVREEDQTIFFTLLGDETFTYTVTAPGQDGMYAFAGVLKDSDKDEQAVEGHSEVTVSSASRPTPTPEGTQAPTPEPTPTPTPEPTPTPTPESTPSPTPVSTATLTPEPTPTPTTPEPTPIPTPESTPSPTPESTATLAPEPTPTPTSTPEPSAVPVPERTPAPPATPEIVRGDAESSDGPATLLWTIPIVLGIGAVLAIIAYLRRRA